MRSATVTEVKNGLSALLDQVRAGQTVLVTDRGVPVARIEPVSPWDDQSGRLERLVRAGVVRPGTGTLPRGFLDGPTVKLPRGVSLVEDVIEERRTGW